MSLQNRARTLNLEPNKYVFRIGGEHERGDSGLANLNQKLERNIKLESRIAVQKIKMTRKMRTRTMMMMDDTNHNPNYL